MSQENPTPEKRQETRQKLLLGVLLLVLAGVVYFQFFSGSGASKRPPGAPPIARVSPSPTPPRRTSGTPAPIISQPLDLASIQTKNVSSGGTGRNIFVYPTPTPPPPPPTPKPTPAPTPYPIQVFSVNPGGVIARTGGFTLTVFGEKMPQDAQGLVNGRAYPTTFVSATQVRIDVPAEAIMAPGNLSVMIRSQSAANIISNQASLNVAAPPVPPYKYVGLITRKNVPTAVLLSQSDNDVYNVKKGEVLGGKWKIINITPGKVEIEDTKIRVSHTINYTGETR